MSVQIFAALAVTVWVAAGVLAALVLLGRQGYRDWRWYVIGAVLGPLFIPMAAERADRSVAVVETVGEEPGAGDTAIVVGVDGSAGSDRAVRLAAQLFDPARTRVVLVTVLDPDTADRPDDDDTRARARAVLADRATWFGPDGAERVATEIVCGQPARAIETVAAAHGTAVIVLGRHGAGRTVHLLGNVAHQVSRHSPVPVVLAEPPEPPHRHAGAHGRHRAHAGGELPEPHP
ncbi:universal stress protein [Actinomycetospora cinnamomea]|uniref:Nucleotide-binding universal stress UspA family protein n=1 Tax=Actinomycetospora cinnamomea TaxID=663609 RepID=A0A2U1F2X0_9PSEU|nr:universal stress protein [Actinomycetospora cinnamomea]PVZ06370.1 nucleotide-binding universal stress UspA family protein [Actinomycetospora cinnamomea]